MALQKFYPLADWLKVAHAQTEFRVKHQEIMAVAIGEYRSPKKGEWYISGAIPEAYYAGLDFQCFEYHIAKLVITKTERVIISDYTENS